MVIKGKSNLEKGCIIGPNCYLDHSTVSWNQSCKGTNILVNAIIHDREILDFGLQVIEELSYE
jgi:bifunctional UDP-N-acetylglucosamine pyrophosphorylase/glucosamine-1-phosphate N-acetyltransferase